MRRGSLEFRPHRRAKRVLPRVRSYPNEEKTRLLGFLGFKAGMSHILMVDDSNSPTKGIEVSRPITVIEIPRIVAYGIRAYGVNEQGYTSPLLEVYDENAAKEVRAKSKHSIQEIKDSKEVMDISLLAFADASSLGFGNKRKYRFEIPVGGKDVNEKLRYIESLLGKELKASQFVKEGEYLDVASISKGKGWQGPIKRFGVARQFRKATGKVRHVGSLGPWHPPKVLYTVPQAGHMGFNYRTELNKRVILVGSKESANKVNVRGGFLHYGLIKNDYIAVLGSIPGSPKRLVRLRLALRNYREIKAPTVTYISTSAKN
ncbi:MAG: 50S ribosomal protein L3 [Candidatus Micrarchaeaceae archaeon]